MVDLMRQDTVTYAMTRKETNAAPGDFPHDHLVRRITEGRPNSELRDSLEALHFIKPAAAYDTDGGRTRVELLMKDAWVWDMYRQTMMRFVPSVRVVTFKDVNIEELPKSDLEL